MAPVLWLIWSLSDGGALRAMYCMVWYIHAPLISHLLQREGLCMKHDGPWTLLILSPLLEILREVARWC